MDLNHDDIQLMLDALKSHECAASKSNLMGSMLGTMLCQTDEQREKFKREEEARAKKDELKQRKLEEDIALLRAKLLMVRRELDSKTADDVLAEASST